MRLSDLGQIRQQRLGIIGRKPADGAGEAARAERRRGVVEGACERVGELGRAARLRGSLAQVGEGLRTIARVLDRRGGGEGGGTLARGQRRRRPRPPRPLRPGLVKHREQPARAPCVFERRERGADRFRQQRIRQLRLELAQRFLTLVGLLDRGHRREREPERLRRLSSSIMGASAISMSARSSSSSIKRAAASASPATAGSFVSGERGQHLAAFIGVLERPRRGQRALDRGGPARLGDVAARSPRAPARARLVAHRFRGRRAPRVGMCGASAASGGRRRSSLSMFAVARSASASPGPSSAERAPRSCWPARRDALW